MGYKKIKGFKALIYVPDHINKNKKHNCKDCFSCQWCSDTRCDLCLGGKKEVIMQEFNIEKIKNVCIEFKSAFQGILNWKWDSRFETVLGEFNIDNKNKVRSVLEQKLKNIWDSSNINSSPDDVNIIINRLGGLMPGQLLFVSDKDNDYFVFCAWWPWGNGKTISIRIAPFCNKLSDIEKQELIKIFKEWIGL